MARTNVTNGFSGLDQITNLMDQLDQMGRTMTNQVKDKVLEAGAEVVKEKIEQHPNLPVSTLSKPHARDHVEIVKDSNGEFKIGFSDEFFYLLFHEIGAKGGVYKGKDGKNYTIPNIPAKPFVRPAFESNKTEIQAAMEAVIRREFGI